MVGSELGTVDELAVQTETVAEAAASSHRASAIVSLGSGPPAKPSGFCSFAGEGDLPPRT